MSNLMRCPRHPAHKYVAGCSGCRRYQRQRVARNRADRLAEGRITHGTPSGYDAGCRCPDCTRVHAAANADYYERKKAGLV